MKVNPRDTLEPLRALLHSPTPDVIEIDALLSSIASTPGAELVWDYFAEIATDRVARQGEGAWELLTLLLRWRPEHPAVPSMDTLLDAWQPEPGALECLALLARRGRITPEVAARRWATAFAHASSRHGGALEEALLDALHQGAIASLALSRALPDVGAARRQACQICALVRPVRPWGGQTQTRAWLGDAVAPIHGLFEALWATLTRQGQAYLHDPVAGRPVGSRGDFYATLEAFAMAASGAAAVADIAERRDEWSQDMIDRVASSFWEEIRAPVFTAGLELPPWSQRDKPVMSANAVSVSPIDVDHALTLTRAASASLTVLGHQQGAQRLRDLTRRLLSL